MRRIILRSILSCLIAISLFQTTTQAQQDSLFIIGLTEICFVQGASSIYTMTPNNPNDFYYWELTYQDLDVSITENYEGNPIEIVWPSPGIYELEGVSEFSNTNSTIEIIVFESGSATEIRSTANFLCPANEADTLGIPICEKVCANSSVIYSVDGEDTEWFIEGSDNFTINGNEAIVEWGDSGTGTVSVVTSALIIEPLTVQCGVYEYTDNGIGSGYVYRSGGTAPYTYTISNGQVAVSDENPAIISELQEGTYSVTVTDANGQSAICEFVIAGDDFGCYLSAYGDVTLPDCQSQETEASIDLTVIGSFGNSIIEWTGPNGFAASGEDIIIPIFHEEMEGDYTVTIIEGFECVRSYSFYLGCSTNNSCSGEASLCVEILEEVEAAFTSTPVADNGTIEICNGQSLYFENQSSNAEAYLWDFGDGNFSTETDPEYIYANPGTYEVILIARNECFCSDTTSVMVEIAPTESPTIDCVGTICPGTSVTYTTDVACSNFEWLVSNNGNIDDGGGMNDNFITITWNDGVEGTIQLTTTSCSGGGCDVPATFIVPILSNDSVIRGPDKVCKEENVIYTIPDFDGTSINWVVSPFGTILSGQGTNEITVQWSGTLPVSNQQFVQVDYDNCYLGCSGSDVLNVNIVPEYFITGDIESCVNGATIYRTQNALNNNPINSNWTVRAADGSVFFTSTGTTNAITVDWAGLSGQYTVQAMPANPDDFCNETELKVKVLATPPKADAIQGEDFICPSETYTYAAISSQSNVNFKWYINNGGTMSEQEGRFVNVTWGNTAPYSISLSQISTLGLPCESDTITLNIEAIAGFTMNGIDEVCEDDIATFSATNFENVFYNWSISPTSAGTITEGTGTNEIEILWHESGTTTVQLNICGMSEIFNVTVHAKPEPIVNHPIGLCEGETVEVTTSVLYTDYVWSNENGVTISTVPNPMLEAGYYKVSAVNDFGCKGDTTFYIDPYTMPEVRISSPSNASLCPGGPMITIYALNEVNGYTYQWYSDNIAISGATNVTHDTNIGGTYQVEVTDENACTARSNSFVIVTCDDIGGNCQNGICFVDPNGGGNTCTSNGTIDFSHTITAFCNEIDFTNTSTNFLPGTLIWNFDDVGSGLDNFSILENPSHTFSDVGFFSVQLTGQVQDVNNPSTGCTRRIIYPVEVKAVANFDWSDACVGEQMDFRDISRFLPTENIIGWNWNFADPSSGTNNTSTDQDPTHIFNTGGIYDIELIITTADGCQASIVKEVEIYAPPIINFNPPLQNCQSTALNFIADVPVTVTSIRWNFGDPNSGAANTSELFDTYHAYENTGNYTVTMTATSIYGCINTFSQAITITPNNLNGNITATPMSPICEGDSIVLTAPAANSWLWTTGETTQSITIHEAGIYKVTVMDDEGCEYNPTPMTIDVIPAPDGSIRAVEYDDFGQPTDYFYENYETCEGEDVYLEMLENANYTYAWSSGGDINSISFTEERGNLLAAGDYNYEVTITDITTGCSNVVGPFMVVVHSLPQNVTISSSASGTLCAGTSTTLSIDNPDATLTYRWNTGETGTSITVFNGGEYDVQATNEFGCSSKSNRITVLEGPRIKNIPSGCHTRCNPDTICLPNMPTVISYQWYLDGVAIPAPEGTIANYIATESGDYTVQMTDIFACNATSDVLILDLFDGFGTLFGNVYFDVNENGVIDAADTLMNGVNILLQDDMGADLDFITSDIDGAYTFLNIPADAYILAVDTLNLADNLVAVLVSSPAELVGCDDMEQFDWLIQKICEPAEENLQFSACTGTSIDYESNTIQAGETLTLNYLTAHGCDSMLHITVVETLPSTATLTLSACDGLPMEYDGASINVGSSMNFNYINAAGCDSTLTVQVIDGSMMVTNILILETCDGEMLTYNGTDYPIGTVEIFNFQNQFGCDSLVELNVVAASTITFDLTTTSTCPNLDNGMITVENINGGATPYEYSLDGTNFQSQPIFNNLTESEYTVTLRDANACIFTKIANIEMSESLEVELLDKELLCGVDNLDLTASLISGNPAEVTWEWEIGGVDNTLTVTEPGIYTLKVSNTCETLNLEAEVTLENLRRESYIYIPNAFSPNGDNINEHFYGQMAADAQLMEYELQIFDRWGNKLFETFDINQRWDGNSGTRKMNPGIYIWAVKAKVESCREEIDVLYNGDVMIMR